MPYLRRTAFESDNASLLNRVAGLLRCREVSHHEKAATGLPLRLGLLGDMSMPFLIPFLEAIGHAMGFAVRTFDAGFGNIDASFLREDSEFYALRRTPCSCFPWRSAPLSDRCRGSGIVRAARMRRWAGLWG